MSFCHSHAQQMRTAALNSSSPAGPSTSGSASLPAIRYVRSIRLGDLNLLTQIGDEEALTSDVVERRGPRLVQRRAIVGTRKVYRARILAVKIP
ncbi:hypothetical protein B0H17DRAFT_1220479 [Mycena rosella]|uniref:Uncharacterized protein n=1 Tax=Mycena rosella TaxID=1033263 RepID=A0AAD7BA12_MYCRO|nr:hypothetical protein B0H17DRAFT_1220479 [Mycena rosella]